MSSGRDTDLLLIDRIRQGDTQAWDDLIGRYEGRLLAFCDSRLRDRHASEDIVQETFIGFLNSLPNYDSRRPLESYLFSICAHKLTDHLRREGRRPALHMSSTGGPESSQNAWQLPGNCRPASSIARSGERRDLEAQAVTEVLESQVARWQERGDWVKLKCIELLIVRGRANKDVANDLGITEQQVANYKFEFLAQMRKGIQRLGLSEEVFPEL
ncbi:MAG: RNA polymerase sigma factor [Pirellulaceae bacterium]|nr:RNA polymerase sigma factor [Planctomycetales bacterium]